MLEGNVKVYPDFTILKMPGRECVYLEHFGMLDDSDYIKTIIYKLNTYQKNRIFLGVNLFVTFETSKNAIDAVALDQLIKRAFCVG